MIRPLTPRDSAAYQALRLRGLQESPTAFISSYSDEARRSLEEIERRVTPAADGSRCVFGAFVGEQLAGLVAFIRSERAKIRHGAELAGMYVAPEHRRQGLGRGLLDAVIDHARSLGGIRQLRLTVNASNVAARALYQSRGFTRIGVEPEAICVDGVYYDEEFYILRLHSPEWASSRGAAPAPGRDDRSVS